MNALKAFKKLQQIRMQEEKISKTYAAYRKLKTKCKNGEVFEIDGVKYAVIIQPINICQDEFKFVPLIED
jgi:hypothetical protein